MIRIKYRPKISILLNIDVLAILGVKLVNFKMVHV